MTVWVVQFQKHALAPDSWTFGCVCDTLDVATAWALDDMARSKWRDEDDYRIGEWEVLTQWP